MPAMIRLKFPKKREDVQLENKFAALKITIPLHEKMVDSYKKIKKVT